MLVSRSLICAADGVRAWLGTVGHFVRFLTKAAGLLAISGWLQSTIARGAEPAPASSQVAKQFKFNKTVSAQLNYLLFLPKDYIGKSQKRWPLMLFLHGAGERGSDIWKLMTHGP